MRWASFRVRGSRMGAPGGCERTFLGSRKAITAGVDARRSGLDSHGMQPVRVAILGTSFGRTVQAVGFQRHPGFELVAIAGRDPDKTRSIAGELGIAAAYGDWRELLARESPGLVSVATPAFLHHDMFLGAVAAGAHVLCEKPTALHRWQAI